MTRRRFEWRFGSHRMALGHDTRIAGMVELAPEHHGGRDPLAARPALDAALAMVDARADLILLSADAWLPGVKRVTEAEELRRLAAVWNRFQVGLGVPWGVVTDKAPVAERAFQAGAEWIFDPAGLVSDLNLPKVTAQHNAALLVGHSRGNPEGWAKMPPVKDPIPGILQSLDASLSRARRGNVLPVSLMADPGLGFGIRREQNAEILAHLSALARLEVPISVGIREEHAALATIAVLQGAHLIRTTEVAAVRSACDWADAILRSQAAREADTPDSSVSRAARPRPER